VVAKCEAICEWWISSITNRTTVSLGGICYLLPSKLWKGICAKAFKQLPHLQNLKVGLCFPFIYPFFLLYIYIYVCVCVCMKEKREKELPLCRVGILFKIYGWFQREEDKQGSNFTLKISECVGRQAFVYYWVEIFTFIFLRKKSTLRKTITILPWGSSF